MPDDDQLIGECGECMFFMDINCQDGYCINRRILCSASDWCINWSVNDEEPMCNGENFRFRRAVWNWKPGKEIK